MLDSHICKRSLAVISKTDCRKTREKALSQEAPVLFKMKDDKMRMARVGDDDKSQI